MVMECKYGGDLFLEFQLWLTVCCVKGSVIPIVDFTTCGRCGVDLISGCVPLAMPSWSMYYFMWSTYSLWGLDGLCAGSCVMFLAGLFFLGLFRSMVWMLVWLCALACCMLLHIVCSLCPCAVVYVTVQRRVCVWVRDIDCCVGLGAPNTTSLLAGWNNMFRRRPSSGLQCWL